MKLVQNFEKYKNL